MMDALEIEKKVRPLSGFSGPVHFEWQTHLSLEKQRDIFKLMNLVLEKEDTIGFPGPLSEADGMKVVGELAHGVANGSKHLLLLYETDTKRLIGHLILTPSSLPNCRHTAEISRVFVHPDCRGLGGSAFWIQGNPGTM